MNKNNEQLEFYFDGRPTIKGYPELRWSGKHPYRSTQYYPAQLKEVYGEEVNGWINKIFWGDNLQVMSHLLKEYRGKIDLIYIDPPFDSKADYKKKIEIRTIGKAETDSNPFEEKQYSDIWNNDDYIQFMYERLIIMRELLSETGSLFMHCDWHQSAYLRIILDEIFGQNNFVNEIIWSYKDVGGGRNNNFYKRKHDTIFWFSKTSNYKTNIIARAPLSDSTIDRFGSLFDENGHITYRKFKEKRPAEFATRKKQGRVPEDLDMVFLSKNHGRQMEDCWTDINPLRKRAQKDNPNEVLEYPTQKPEELLKRLVETVTVEGDLVFDCFMGSGTTQSVAMKLGRKFIGADINLGAIQTATKRFLNNMKNDDCNKFPGFEVYNVNNYDFFRNPVEAKDILISALEIQKFPGDSIWDGELDGRKVKIMPVNRIATKADLKPIISNLPYKQYQKLKEEMPNKSVEKITLVCMGHEPDLKGTFEQEVSSYNLDVEIMDILRDKKELQLKRDSEAEVVREDGNLIVKNFYPMNLLQKLSLQKESVENWQQLVDSIVIDWNYDGATMHPTTIDIPDKKELVSGEYVIPEDAGTIKIKITDVLSESIELEV